MSGATASLHVREAVAGGTGFLWEINGSDGTLRLSAEAAYPEIYPLDLAGAQGHNNRRTLTAGSPDGQVDRADRPGRNTPYNVGRAYAGFAADVSEGTHSPGL